MTKMEFHETNDVIVTPAIDSPEHEAWQTLSEFAPKTPAKEIYSSERGAEEVYFSGKTRVFGLLAPTSTPAVPHLEDQYKSAAGNIRSPRTQTVPMEHLSYVETRPVAQIIGESGGSLNRILIGIGLGAPIVSLLGAIFVLYS